MTNKDYNTVADFCFIFSAVQFFMDKLNISKNPSFVRVKKNMQVGAMA